MARERWFYAPTHKRQGPMPLAQLVEGLLRLPDPRSCLVWKHGLAAWTPAGSVNEVDQHLAPFVIARKPEAPLVPPGPAAPPPRIGDPAASAARVRPAARGQEAAGPSPLVYAGAGLGVLALGALVWLFWPAAPAPRPVSAEAGTPKGMVELKEGDPVDASGTGSPATPGAAGFTGWSDQEDKLPPSEVIKLKGVAGWAGRNLEMTVYNGSTWRLTKLTVSVRRLVKGEMVEDEQRLTLLPQGAQVEQGVDQLMNRVAPGRSKPGVNPLDTGKLLGEAGDRPEGFGTTIVGAFGYPPK